MNAHIIRQLRVEARAKHIPLPQSDNIIPLSVLRQDLDSRTRRLSSLLLFLQHLIDYRGANKDSRKRSRSLLLLCRIILLVEEWQVDVLHKTL